MTELYAELTGQDTAIAALRAAVRRPVHAYLFVGPPGTGKTLAARHFATSLLCPAAGDGTCEICQRVRSGLHPDVIFVDRDGPHITMDSARQVSRLAVRSPVEGGSKVLILADFHLVRDAGPALLKTIEEPSPSTTFVILAEYVPPELVTIASRCVRVDFSPLTPQQVAEVLVGEGVDEATAIELAAASGGRLDRARLLAADSGYRVRRAMWSSIPDRLDGTGATATALAGEILAATEGSAAPLHARHEVELQALEERQSRDVEINGSRRGAVKSDGRQVQERHRRELRRQRSDEMRAGLAFLAAAYRAKLVLGAPDLVACLEALGAIERLGEDLSNNPGEELALQALLMRLSHPPAGQRVRG